MAPGWSLPRRRKARWCRAFCFCRLVGSFHLLGTALLFGPVPPVVLNVQRGTPVTPSLSEPGKLRALPALGRSACQDFRLQTDAPSQFPLCLCFGIPLGVVDTPCAPVFFRAGFAPRLPWDGGFTAVPAQSLCLGAGKFLFESGALLFCSGLGRQRDSCLLRSLGWFCLLEGFIFGITVSPGDLTFFSLAVLLRTAFFFAPFYLEGMFSKISFCTTYPRECGGTSSIA